MTDSDKKDIDAIFADGTEIDAALRRAAQKAVLRHKLLGHPIAIWRDNQVVWIEPKDISVPRRPGEPGEP